MKRFTILLALCLVFVAGSANAAFFNSRPAAGVTAGELTNLQNFLNVNDGGIDVIADQNGAAIWTTTISGNSTFTMKLEAAAFATSNKLGIYNYGAPGTKFEVFQGTDAVGHFAVATFNAGGVAGKLVVSRFDAAATLLGQTTYLGVNSSNFGFYLDSPDGMFYSEDDLNEQGLAHNLVYAGTGINAGNWWLAFEDLNRVTGSDEDFTDMVVFAESINPVPEPGTLALFGFGLASGAAMYRRKRAAKKA